MKTVKILRKIILSKNYYFNRMSRMERESSFYVDLVGSAKNAILRESYIKMALVYLKRYKYYFKKAIGYEFRESI